MADSIGGRVLLDACHPPGARDGSKVVPLSKEPSKCDLRRGRSGLGGHLLDLSHDPEIVLEVGCDHLNGPHRDHPYVLGGVAVHPTQGPNPLK
jgi:hypothetical protein